MTFLRRSKSLSLGLSFFVTTIFILAGLTCYGQGKPGAHIPWTTYEAENMTTNGIVLGPKYKPYQVETESSGQQCVKLKSDKQYVAFTASAEANSMVIRYSLPDSNKGRGTKATLAVYKDGRVIKHVAISSYLEWLYGKYPFSNNPRDGKPRDFYNEKRIFNLQIKKGDVIKIMLDNTKAGNASYCIIDLVDLEQVAPPIQQPLNSISLTGKEVTGNNIKGDDYTKALRKCIAMASKTGKSVWIPKGSYKITGNIILPSNITIQGAGMWYSRLVGDKFLYKNPDRRVRLIGAGSRIHLAGFAITGKLNYRNDTERNDGIVGSFGINSTISNVWVSHTKVGMWIQNTKNLVIKGCRLRNTIADGINLCVGVTQSSIENCTAMGTGDDCFAIWPATFTKQKYAPGENRIVHCTAQLPFLANGAAIYGGKNNQIAFCKFIDISQGSAILVSTTFPTENPDKNINNNFSGTTLIKNCIIKTSGGFDHEWAWRAAVEICLDKRNISGIKMENLQIENSLSNGLSIIAKNTTGHPSLLSNTLLQNIKITNVGLGMKNSHALFIAKEVHGSINLIHSAISDIKNDSKNFVIVRNK